MRIPAALFVLAWPWPVAAAEPPYRSGFECAAAVSALGSFADLSSDYEAADPYAEFEALGPHLELRIGGFLGNRVAFGAQVSYSHQWTAAPHVRGATKLDDASSVSSVSAALLGPYLVVYPVDSSGWFLGAGAGVGRATFPSFAFTSHGLAAAFFSLELGFELERWRSSAFVSYRRLAGSDFEREGMSSHDLGLGWRFRLAGP